jgi:Tfp pilus assembly protein PilP
MKKMAYLKMLLKRLDEKSREYRQIQAQAPNCFDIEAFISEEEKERREAEDKARKAARAAYRDIEMYMFGVIDSANPTSAEYDDVIDKMNNVYREMAAIYHQDGVGIDKAIKAVCDCIK